MAQKNGVREWGKYGIRCIYNRKNVCSYLHATFVPNDGKVEAFVNEINKKFDILENKLKKEQEKHKVNSEIGKKIYNKFEVLENQVHHLKKAVEEKDIQMSLLEKRIVGMEKRIPEEKGDEFDKKVKYLENIIKKQ